MTLTEIADEYLRESIRIKAQIEDTLILMRTDQAGKYNKRLRILTDMYHDTIMTYHRLKNYYRK